MLHVLQQSVAFSKGRCRLPSSNCVDLHRNTLLQHTWCFHISGWVCSHPDCLNRSSETVRVWTEPTPAVQGWNRPLHETKRRGSNGSPRDCAHSPSPTALITTRMVGYLPGSNCSCRNCRIPCTEQTASLTPQPEHTPVIGMCHLRGGCLGLLQGGDN